MSRQPTRGHSSQMGSLHALRLTLFTTIILQHKRSLQQSSTVFNAVSTVFTQKIRVSTLERTHQSPRYYSVQRSLQQGCSLHTGSNLFTHNIWWIYISLQHIYESSTHIRVCVYFFLDFLRSQAIKNMQLVESSTIHLIYFKKYTEYQRIHLM